VLPEPQQLNDQQLDYRAIRGAAPGSGCGRPGRVAIQTLVVFRNLHATLASWPFNLLNVLAAGIIVGLALTWPRAT
jgi:hypothetical protein